MDADKIRHDLALVYALYNANNVMSKQENLTMDIEYEYIYNSYMLALQSYKEYKDEWFLPENFPRD